MDNDTIIQVHSLNIWYHHLHAIKNASLNIVKHKITAFIGPSGSGKSTLLRSLNRMLDTIPKTKITGKILFEGEDLVKKDIDVISLRRKIGMVFQNPTPFQKSIYDNVAYGLEVQGISKKKGGGFLDFFTRAGASLKDIETSTHPLDVAVVKSLKEAALWHEVKDRLHHSAFRLAGGQQQRLCIARAIAVRPEVLLLDEPCSDLDPISTRKIEQLLMHLKNHYTIVIVTHNLSQAKRIADYTAFFHLGTLEEFLPTKKMFDHPEKELTRDFIHGAFG